MEQGVAFLFPSREEIVFPGGFAVLPVSREGLFSTVRALESSGGPLVVVPQADPGVEELTLVELNTVGVVVRVHKILQLPDGRMKLLVEGLDRANIDPKPVSQDGMWFAKLRMHEESGEPTVRATALAAEVREALRAFAEGTGMLGADAEVLVANEFELDRIADQAVGFAGLPRKTQLGVLNALDMEARLQAALDGVAVAVERQKIGVEIENTLQAHLDKQQREYQLKEQLKAIQQELGDVALGSRDADQFEARIKESGMPEAVAKDALREVQRLRRIPTDSAEYNITRTWLDNLCQFPWAKESQDNPDLPRASQILDEDHHALEDVKERILEYLAVRQLRPDARGAILCFVGAPGVGKTSLGRSIARSLGREFQRIGLGGMKDESEIRGHRRTYIGALPGRIVRAMIRAGTRNPVIVLDEIDKIGSDFRGDPSSALLEVLDPEQNHAFTDHYMDAPVDLSRVLFIATANLADPIPPALYDRFEIIEIPGYTEEEKVKIARKFLMPRLAEDHGLKPEQVVVEGPALSNLVSDYTREAGLRNLNRQLAAIYRKVARQVVEGRDKPVRVRANSLKKYLGPKRFHGDLAAREPAVGVVVGLAWTAAGGDILYIEALTMDGSFGLKLTGSLGDVMKESAEAAMSWLRAHRDQLSIPESSFKQAFHLHVPAGAIPKDGPSAGVSMLTALASRLTGRAVRPRVAMTGEITLRGRVLAVGGIKEKVLAARRAGVREIILPKANAHDLERLPVEVQRDVTFHLVEQSSDVLELALEPAETV